MSDPFFSLSARARQEVLSIAAEKSGRAQFLLEKDAWVVWALRTLYASSFGEHLAFKGGTSLSKAYRVIRRFSEDVDITYDIRQIIPELASHRLDAIPLNRSEEQRWSREVRTRLPRWVGTSVKPLFEGALSAEALSATISVSGERLVIDYDPGTSGAGYVRPAVVLEFGGRSTGEPTTVRDVKCDADGLVAGVSFPTARPRVMSAERTFWEKATAMHVFCLQTRVRGERLSRHWHDIARLAEAGIAVTAISNREIAEAVAHHKSAFFVEKTASHETIDYMAAVSGGLRLVPEGEAAGALKDDYGRMVDARLLHENAESFEELMAKCRDVETAANQMARGRRGLFGSSETRPRFA